MRFHSESIAAARFYHVIFAWLPTSCPHHLSTTPNCRCGMADSCRSLEAATSSTACRQSVWLLSTRCAAAGRCQAAWLEHRCIQVPHTAPAAPRALSIQRGPARLPTIRGTPPCNTGRSPYQYDWDTPAGGCLAMLARRGSPPLAKPAPAERAPSTACALFNRTVRPIGES